MNERPILFSGAMVRALLAGTKTQTRRIVKLPPGGLWALDELRMYPDGERRAVFHDIGEGEPIGIRCPYGQPGDRLWVREAFAAPSIKRFYRADGDDLHWAGMRGMYNFKWTPSIHMPRWASRLTLAVESVRVERLHEIDDAGARAEGVGEVYRTEGLEHAAGWTERDAFACLWRRINGPESWDANPWVWVIGFSRVTKGGGR